MAPKNTPRFASIVEQAVSASGLTQAQLHQRGGPTDTTLRKIIKAEPVGLSPTTLKKLETAFEWEEGSAARALAGGDAPNLDPAHRQEVHDAIASTDPDVMMLLSEIISGQVDEDTREKAQQVFDEIAIRDFPALFGRLSRRGKVQVVRWAGRILFLEEHGDPYEGQINLMSPTRWPIVSSPLPEDHHANSDTSSDTAPTPQEQGASSEAGEDQKTAGTGGLTRGKKPTGGYLAGKMSEQDELKRRRKSKGRDFTKDPIIEQDEAAFTGDDQPTDYQRNAGPPADATDPPPGDDDIS